MIKLKNILSEITEAAEIDKAKKFLKILDICKESAIPIYRGVSDSTYGLTTEACFTELNIRSDRRPKDTGITDDCFIEAYRRLYYPDKPSRRQTMFCTNSKMFAEVFGFAKRVILIFPKKSAKIYVFKLPGDTLAYMGENVLGPAVKWEDESTNVSIALDDENYPTFARFVIELADQYKLDNKDIESMTLLFVKYLPLIKKELDNPPAEGEKELTTSGKYIKGIIAGIKEQFQSAEKYWSNVIQISSLDDIGDSDRHEIYIADKSAYGADEDWFFKYFSFNEINDKFSLRRDIEVDDND